VLLAFFRFALWFSLVCSLVLSFAFSVLICSRSFLLLAFCFRSAFVYVPPLASVSYTCFSRCFTLCSPCFSRPLLLSPQFLALFPFRFFCCFTLPSLLGRASKLCLYNLIYSAQTSLSLLSISSACLHFLRERQRKVKCSSSTRLLSSLLLLTLEASGSLIRARHQDSKGGA